MPGLLLAVAGAGAAVVAAPYVIGAVIGVTAAGPLATGLFAAYQASGAAVGAGTAMAGLQSVAMGGAMSSLATTVTAAVGGLGGYALALIF